MIYPSKRLIFYFYIKDNWIENITNRIHLLCLKHYAHIFDEAVFVISVDDINNYELIHSFEMAVLDLGFTPNISFKIVENTYLREARTFYDLIAKKLEEYDGITFFGHNKGISYTDVTEDTLKWITALYYFNLGVELPYNGLNGKCFYGALKSKDIFIEDYTERSDVVLPKYNWVYCGTFFWGKYQEIDNILKNMGRSVPGMYSRWFDEMFPGNVLEEFWGSCYGECDVSRKLVLGNNIDEYIASTYEGNEWVCSDFYEFYENILKNEGIR